MSSASTTPSKEQVTAIKLVAAKVARVLVWLVYAWVLVVLVMLTLAFVLQLLGANPNAGFAEWVYRSTDRIMAPFRGVFEPITFSDKSVLDTSMLFAMIIYVFVAFVLHVAIDWLTGKVAAGEVATAPAPAPSPAPAPTAAAGATMTTAVHGSSDNRLVVLSGAAGVNGSAVLTPHDWGTSIDLTVAGLDPAETYTAWMERTDGGRVSVGRFRPTTTAAVRAAFSTSHPLAGSRAIGVALLPGGDAAGAVDILSAALV